MVKQYSIEGPSLLVLLFLSLLFLKMKIFMWQWNVTPSQFVLQFRPKRIFYQQFSASIGIYFCVHHPPCSYPFSLLPRDVFLNIFSSFFYLLKLSSLQLIELGTRNHGNSLKIWAFGYLWNEKCKNYMGHYVYKFISKYKLAFQYLKRVYKKKMENDSLYGQIVIGQGGEVLN